MVEPAKNNVITVKLNGTTVKLNTETLKGISVDKSSPLFLRKADRGDAGVISDKDAAKMMELLNKIAKNGTISAKDFEKAKLGDKNDFNKMIAATTKKVETSTVKNKDNSTTRTERHEDGSITKITTSVDGKVTQNYDANGKLTSKVSVNSEGSTASKYKYDENGNLTSVNTVNRTPQKKIKNQVNSTFKYDEAGNRIGENHVQIDRRGRIVSNTAVVIKNNADGLPIEKETVVSNPSGVAVAHSVEKNQYKDGTLSAKTQVNSDQNGTTTTSKTYAEDGRTVLNVIQDVKNKDGTTGHTEQKHNKNGKLLEKHTISRDANGKIVDDLTSKAEYINDGNIIQKWTVKGTKNGYPHDSVTKYDENGKMQTIDSTFYVRGGKVEEHYEGANLENRNCFIPSKQITYEEDGKTIKNVTVNKFDKDGVLIGSEIQDKDGKVIESHDFSKIDGKFDTSYQKGRGDCYLLAGLNALRESEGGREALKQTITTGKDPETGETTYTVHFPGAAKIRENLIKQGVPEDKIDIMDSYTYTESEIHEKAKLAGKSYSAGDKDVLLLEVAYEDMRTDAKADIEDLHQANPKLSKQQIYKELHIQGLNARDKNDNLRTGQESDAMFMLTGKESYKYTVSGKQSTSDAPVCSIDSELNMTVTGGEFKLSEAENAKLDKMFDTIEQDCKDGKLDNHAATASFNVSSQTVNGKVIVGGGHAFTITKVEGDNVYLRNPWDPTKEIVMTRDEIKKSATSVALLDVKADNTSETGSGNGSGNVTNPGQGGNVQNPVNGGSGQTNPGQGNNLQPGGKFKIPQGQRYTVLLADALKAQGIEPTPENIKKASAQFQAANKGAVKTYHGSNAKWRGNKYLITDMVVTIPKFEV